MTLVNAFIWTLIGLKMGPLPEYGTMIVPRSDWGARPPTLVECIKPPNTPLKYVIIHHSYKPEACYTNEDCRKKMRIMQDMHQLTNGWNDIGYSFAVGGDGLTYAGRGFNIVGAHSPKYNDKSLGICLIGDWRTDLPPENMLKAAKLLIVYGVKQGYVDANFTLYGHRQVRETECPGDRLFNEISTWPHFSSAVPPLK